MTLTEPFDEGESKHAVLLCAGWNSDIAAGGAGMLVFAVKRSMMQVMLAMRDAHMLKTQQMQEMQAMQITLSF